MNLYQLQTTTVRKLSKWIMVYFKGLNLIKGQITNTYNVLRIKTPLVAFVILFYYVQINIRIKHFAKLHVYPLFIRRANVDGTPMAI